MYGFATECWCFLVKEGSQLPFPLLLPLDLKCLVPGNKVNKVNGVKGQPPVLRHFRTASPSGEDAGETRRSTAFARSEAGALA